MKITAEHIKDKVRTLKQEKNLSEEAKLILEEGQEFFAGFSFGLSDSEGIAFCVMACYVPSRDQSYLGFTISERYPINKKIIPDLLWENSHGKIRNKPVSIDQSGGKGVRVTIPFDKEMLDNFIDWFIFMANTCMELLVAYFLPSWKQ